MTVTPWHLPWTSGDVPHALVDINRGCNVVCRFCYNLGAGTIKSLTEIEQELKTLMELRKLDSVSLVGGEVLLHPSLCEIVRMIKRYGLRVEIFTNGVLIDDHTVADLAEAGADMIFLHIEPGQKRSDLPESATFADVCRLITEKTCLVAKHHVDVGLAMTVCEDEVEHVVPLIQFTLDSRDINYFVLTLARQSEVFKAVEGDLLQGISGTINENIFKNRTDRLANDQMMKLLKDCLGLTPFAYLGSNRDLSDPRWVSYVIGTLQQRNRPTFFSCLKSSWTEKIYMQVYRFLKGRYPFYLGQTPILFRIQLVLNTLTGGAFRRNIGLLWRSLRPGTALRCRRILFQNPADIGQDGNITHCVNCPDATIKNGRLVPVCLSDRVA